MTARLSCHLQTCILNSAIHFVRGDGRPGGAHLFQGFVIWTPTIEKSLIEEPRSSRSWQIDLTTS